LAVIAKNINTKMEIFSKIAGLARILLLAALCYLTFLTIGVLSLYFILDNPFRNIEFVVIALLTFISTVVIMIKRKLQMNNKGLNPKILLYVETILFVVSFFLIIFFAYKDSINSIEIGNLIVLILIVPLFGISISNNLREIGNVKN
jgi:lysylphosphatidylglycerol synthetase-like protein (DUF2156 family)